MSSHWSKGITHFNYWNASLADEFVARINAMLPPDAGYRYSGYSINYCGPLWISDRGIPLTWTQMVDVLIRHKVDVTELIADIEKSRVIAEIGANI